MSAAGSSRPAVRRGRPRAARLSDLLQNARKLNEDALVANARLAGATPMLEWIGDGDTLVFSYEK
jgi:hypothetical protein